MTTQRKPPASKQKKQFDDTGRRFTNIRACLGTIRLIEFKPRQQKAYDPDPILEIETRTGRNGVYLTKSARRRLARLLEGEGKK